MVAISKLPSQVTPFPDKPLPHCYAVLTFGFYDSAQCAVVGASGLSVLGPGDVQVFQHQRFQLS